MKQVDLSKALSDKAPKLGELIVSGLISADAESKGAIRLYPNPLSPLKYYVIQAEDVLAVYELEQQELLHTQVLGTGLHWVKIGHDAHVSVVTTHKKKASELMLTESHICTDVRCKAGTCSIPGQTCDGCDDAECTNFPGFPYCSRCR